MNKTFKSLLLVLTIAFFLSCEEEIEFDYATSTITTENFEQCEVVQCPELSLNYLDFKAPATLAQNINENTKKLLFDLLTFEGQEATSITQAAELYLTNAQNAYPEDSVFSETHVLHLDITVSYQSNDVLTLRNDYYQFAGGAHGVGGIGYVNYDPKTGEEIPSESLFKDVEAFTAFAKAKFIKTHGTIDQFWFEDELYTLPANIGFNNDGLILYYGVYEIAPYADGDFELIFTWDEIEEYLVF